MRQYGEQSRRGMRCTPVARVYGGGGVLGVAPSAGIGVGERSRFVGCTCFGKGCLLCSPCELAVVWVWGWQALMPKQPTVSASARRKALESQVRFAAAGALALLFDRFILLPSFLVLFARFVGPIAIKVRLVGRHSPKPREFSFSAGAPRRIVGDTRKIWERPRYFDDQAKCKQIIASHPLLGVELPEQHLRVK